MQKHKIAIPLILLCTTLSACGNSQEDTYVEDTFVEDTFVEDNTVIVDEVEIEPEVVTDSSIRQIEVDDQKTGLVGEVEELSKFEKFDMLEVTLDEIPFTIGDNLSDYVSNLSVIGYRLDANIRCRNLSAGQSLDIPIISETSKTIGYIRIYNDDIRKHTMKNCKVMEFTIMPDQVLSLSAFGVTQSSTYEDTKFALGEADESELTTLFYESDLGTLTCSYTATGQLTSIKVTKKESD